MLLALLVAALLIAGVVCFFAGAGGIGFVLLIVGAIFAVVLIGVLLAGRRAPGPPV